MDDFIIAVIILLCIVIAGYIGAHSNIEARKVEIAIELCEPNGGLEFVDWSNAGCKNGAVIDLYKHLSDD